MVVGSLTGDDRQVLFSGGTDARYLPTGHIVYIRGGVLMARAVDLGRLEVGAEVHVMEGVGQSQTNLTGAGHFDFSDLGALVYVEGTSASLDRPMPVVWVTRNTGMVDISGDRDNPAGPRLSSDESHVAVMVTGADGVSHIEFQNLSRGVWTRLTTAGDGQFPLWSHDGRSVYFTSNRGPQPAIYRRPIDLSAPAEEVWSPGFQSFLMADSISNDGGFLFATTWPGDTTAQAWAVQLDDPPNAEIMFDGVGVEAHVQMHPSGEWIAYVRETQTRVGVFVTEFPVGRTWRISAGDEESQEPMWSRDGTQLFFRVGEKMMVVDVQTEPEFEPEAPRELISQFIAPRPMSWINTSAYDVAADGRFLTTIATSTGLVEDDTPSVRVVLNWFEELKRLVPTGR